MDDDWENTQFGSLSQSSGGDFDLDEMTNGEEYLYGFVPTIKDALDDADGDRYPNIFELRRGSAPNNAGSIPTATYVVNGAGGGTHTTVSAAINAANIQNGDYQIIGIASGVYTGVANLSSVRVTASAPKLLVIGLGGASQTVIDGTANTYGWTISGTAVLSSLTFRNTRGALVVDAPGKELRLLDLVVHNNVSPDAQSYYGAALHVWSAAKIHVAGSTFFDNGGGLAPQLSVNNSAASLMNTVVWAKASGTTSTTTNYYGSISATYSFVKGQTFTGNGNLPGTLNPKIRADGHLLWDSPLRGAGGSGAQSRIDIDGETRPSSGPDVGVDQFVDTDADQLADAWELAMTGGLTTLTSRAQDADGDGLTNDQEHAAVTNPVLADTDADGVSDGAEVSVHGSDPLKMDTDGDDMPDGWEANYGLSLVVANGFDDADGDRYPNVFEFARASDPSAPGSIPSPTFVVDGAGGGTHATVSAAVNAALLQNGGYQIIGIAPGVYSGLVNLSDVSVGPSRPKLLIVGLQGAAKTIIDGSGINGGWTIANAAVLSSLTFRNARRAVLVNAEGYEVRLVDLFMYNNIRNPLVDGSTAIYVARAKSVEIVGSTILDDSPELPAVAFNNCVAALTNSVVWSKAARTMVSSANYASVTSNYSLVKGQILPGTGNLAGSVDPKFRLDMRPAPDSPLRGAGGATGQSRLDWDGDPRPSSAPDIGVDQLYDADNDGLQDSWEIAVAGSIAAVSGAGDEDRDGLSNASEYMWGTDWVLQDTDRDGVLDGLEVTIGTNPVVSDSDDLVGDVNQDGIVDSVGVQLGYLLTELDDDGDSVSNADEALMCTNPLRVDSDGDGAPDNTDALPLDPLVSVLPSSVQDTAPPVITLTTPWYACELMTVADNKVEFVSDGTRGAWTTTPRVPPCTGSP